MDDNGAYHFSAIAIVEVNKANAIVKVYPNPAKDVINIRLNQSADQAIITLINTVGQTVYTTTVSSVVAGQLVHVPVVRLAGGVYVVRIICGKDTFTQHLLVE